MQKYTNTLKLGLAVLAGVVLAATALRPQVPPVGTVWEYATVTSAPLTICYAQKGGCKNERVYGVSDYPSNDDPMMPAAMRLGERGWELAAVAEAGGHRVLYFKRLQSVLNRNESR